MRSKSIIFYDDMDQLVKNPPKYGQLLFESYWRRDNAGNIQESTPTTSEYLDGFFWPFQYQIDDLQITLNGAESGFMIEETTAAGNVHVERVVWRPAAPLKFDVINNTPIKLTLDNIVNICNNNNR